MTWRDLLSLLVCVATTATSAAFAPAPVYREPLRPKVPEILSAIQGTWNYDRNLQLGGGRGGLQRTIRVRIQGNTWTYLYLTNGVEREGARYDIVVDTKQNPPALDLRHAVVNQIALPGGQPVQFALKGIVKVEGETLTYCYVSGHNPNPIRPRHFEANQVLPNGSTGSTMTLERIR